MATREISLSPYPGRLFLTKTAKGYQTAHRKLFKTPDVLACDIGGRFSGGEGKDGLWTYLVWAEAPEFLVHELSHVVLHVFNRCGIDPRDAGGEPFCYLLAQLFEDSQ